MSGLTSICYSYSILRTVATESVITIVTINHVLFYLQSETGGRLENLRTSTSNEKVLIFLTDHTPNHTHHRSSLIIAVTIVQTTWH